MSIYTDIKSRLTTREVAEKYGISVNHSGMALCPFHGDKNPSMKIDKNFICFGCGEKGDVIAFTSKLFQISAYDAAKKLIEDFNLDIDTKKIKPSRISQISHKREAQFTDTIEKRKKVYVKYLDILEGWRVEYKPKEGETPCRQFVEMCHNYDYIDYVVSTLCFGTIQEKVDIIVRNVKEMSELEKKLNEYESGKTKTIDFIVL